MNSGGVKRKSPDSDFENEEKNKKPRIEMKHLLKQLYQLSGKIRSYNHIIENGDRAHSLIIENLNKAIHRIVVCGNQSSGKSSLIQKLTKSERIIKPGLGTRCPIEFRCSSTCEKIYVNWNGKNYNFGSIIEAEESIISQYKDGLFPGTIIQESKSEEEVYFIDLPGYNSFTHQNYYNDIKKSYLDVPNTTIVHVMRGDTDPQVDMALNYLQGTKNDVITVLTHTDVWKYDKKKQEYLYMIANMPHVKTLFITSAIGDEVEILKDVDISSIQNKIVKKGTAELRNYLVNLNTKRTVEFIPEGKLLCTQARDFIHNQLTTIGFSLNIRDTLVHFRREMSDKIKKEFNQDHTVFSASINEVKKSINPGQIKDIFDKVNVETISQDLRNGSRRQVKGSEGWNSVVVKYIQVMIYDVKNILYDFFEKYTSVLENVTTQLLSSPYKPCTTERQNFMMKEAKNKLDSLYTTLVENFEKELEMISTDPFVDWDQYSSSYLVDFYEPFAKQIVNMMTNGHKYEDIKKMTQYALNNMGTDPYDIKAKNAYTQLKHMWSVISNSIYNQLVTYASNMDRKYEEYLDILVQETEAEDLKEDENVNKKREALKDLLECCDNILYSIK